MTRSACGRASRMLCRMRRGVLRIRRVPWRARQILGRFVVAIAGPHAELVDAGAAGGRSRAGADQARRDRDQRHGALRRLAGTPAPPPRRCCCPCRHGRCAAVGLAERVPDARVLEIEGVVARQREQVEPHRRSASSASGGARKPRPSLNRLARLRDGRLEVGEDDIAVQQAFDRGTPPVWSRGDPSGSSTGRRARPSCRPIARRGRRLPPRERRRRRMRGRDAAAVCGRTRRHSTTRGNQRTVICSIQTFITRRSGITSAGDPTTTTFRCSRSGS